MIFLVGGGHIASPDGAARIEPEQLADWTFDVVQYASAAGVVGYALEIGNEPDLAHPGYANRPDEFARAVGLCHRAARTAGFQGAVMTGGISNLNRRGVNYLARMLASPHMPPLGDFQIGFHRYPEAGRGPLAPHDGFCSRDDEWDTLMALVGRTPVVCTEFGYHTAASAPVTLSNSAVTSAVLWDLAFFRERYVSAAVLYQLNDGPTDAWIDRYGVRQIDGTWKPVAEHIRALYGPPDQ